MSDTPRPTAATPAEPGEEADWHRRFAVELFNRTWDLLERPDRSPEDDAELLAAAFGSRWHWGRVGSAENRALGDHQIAKVAAELGLVDLALCYARSALEQIEAGRFGDWQLAAGYEGMARACTAAGDLAGRDYWVERCTAALGSVTKASDRAAVADQLLSLPEIRLPE